MENANLNGTPTTVAESKRQVSKPVLLVSTLCLGAVGGHKLYLGKWLQFTLSLLFCWTGIPSLIALVEFIIYASTEKLNEKYSAHVPSVVMIVLSVLVPIVTIGIFASIALTASGDYQRRGNMVELIVSSQGAKTTVSEYFSKNNKLPSTELAPDTAGEPVGRVKVKIARGGVVVATVPAELDAKLAGKALIMVPKVEGNNLTWTCGVQDESMLLVVPSSCRTVLPMP